ncbi:MAG TPA: potassium-transporting ATPase subunit KdpA [Solirubrobacteraceae bacterium]|nr:potassium-transporting ATPase subunit KdpA [Solirubrobacteraceae bacterium]
MTSYGWLTLLFLGALLALSTPLLGNYMAKVYSNGPAPGDRFFLPVERFVYRVCRIDPESEQRWRTYVTSLLIFTLFGMLLTYVILRIQQILPGNPDNLPAVTPGLAFNTAVSFGTNTNWTNYTGEATMSQLSQIIGLVWHQFISAAVGMALAAAFIRAIARRRGRTLGNFWADTVRSTTRILIPLSFVFAIVLMSQGVIDNFHASTTVTTVAAQATHSKAAALQQTIPGGPVASMTPIEMLGDNGGGYFGANAGHPLENPSGFVNIILLWLTAMIPFAFCWTYGRMVGSMRQGRMVLTVMTVMFAVSVLIVVPLEQRGNVKLNVAGVTQKATATNPGGNLEGKDLRLGAVGSALNAADVTATSTGGTASAHESYTPLGGSIPLFNMMLGEVIPGGTGTGLFGLLIFVMITVFIAGLMVGRTPSYLGKQILAPDMKLAAIYILVLPTTVLILAGIAVLLPSGLSQVSTSPPHGLTEVVYAFTSAAHNNGSAFGGLAGNVPFYNITLAIAMFFGRFFEIIPALALAGSLVRKRTFAATAGTLRTDTPLFTFMVMAVVFVLVGLTYFPALALGPLVEHLQGHFGI